MIPRRIVVNVIAFLVLSALLVAALVVNIFRIEPRYAVTATFRDTGGVFTGQEVTYRGVTVGRVGDLRVVEQGVEIDLVISRRFDRIPQDTRARVMFKSAVGEQFVDLLPNTDQPPFLDAGSTIPIERTELPVQQEELLRLLESVLAGVPVDDMAQLVDTLGTGLGGRGEDLRLLLRSLDPISATLAGRTGEINSLQRNADRAGAAFSRTSEDFVVGVRQLANVSESLARSSPELERLLRAGANDLPVVAALLSSRKAEIDRTIANLADVTRISHEHLASVRDLLDWLPLFLFAVIDSFDGQN
ncbi:MAG TPA: MlaD family protein, partial [Actinomycetota bacterium]|nr:MlaD family protein [Actinomycetota bacterium]